MKNRTAENLFCQSVQLSASFFELTSGAAEYSAGIGSDSYTSFSFLVERGGFRDDRMFTEVEDWIYGFAQSLCDEEQELEVDDQDEGIAVDWHEEVAENYWDKLESEY